MKDNMSNLDEKTKLSDKERALLWDVTCESIRSAYGLDSSKHRKSINRQIKKAL